MKNILKFVFKLYKFIFRQARFLYWRRVTGAKNISVSEHVRILGSERMTLGDDIHIGRFSWLQTIDEYMGQCFNPRLNIGDGVKTSELVHIGCAFEISIGKNCLIASKVLIIDHQHGNTSLDNMMMKPVNRPLEGAPIKIGDNVFIGDNSVIFPGVTIGDNSIIGAGSIVTRSIPENSVAIGNPVKIIKQNKIQ